MTIKTKYNIGDIVFYMVEGIIYEGIVIEISISKIGGNIIYLYHVGKDGTYSIFSENCIFLTKEELLNKFGVWKN
jgi:hypothetical protein